MRFRMFDYRMGEIVKRSFYGFFTVVLFILPTAGQVKTGEFTLTSIDRILGCEEEVALQDLVVTEALRVRNANSLVFAVVRPGDGEVIEELTKERSHRARRYFAERGNRLGAENSMVVLGNTVPGPGRLEYYVNGTLHLRLIYRLKGHICYE